MKIEIGKTYWNGRYNNDTHMEWYTWMPVALVGEYDGEEVYVFNVFIHQADHDTWERREFKAVGEDFPLMPCCLDTIHQIARRVDEGRTKQPPNPLVARVSVA